MKATLFIATAAAAVLAGIATSTNAAPSENCDTESLQAMAPPDTTISIAAREGAGCRVMGYITTRNPGPNKVHFTLGLPDRFNGRYVFLGIGGAAGTLPILRPQLLAKGYVVTGTDAGTGARNMSDFTFRKNPAKEADFGGRGVHVSAVATQHIVRNYFKTQQPIRRYITGCSGGGQMGLRSALRFGTKDFDGFIVGATPWTMSANMPNSFRIAQHLQVHPEGWIPPDLMAKVDAAILAAYDGTDGAVDGIILDQRNIAEFDVGILQKLGLTPAQITTFDLIRKTQDFALAGVGTRAQPGYSITNVRSWSAFLLGTKAPPWPDSERHSSVELAESGVPFIHIMADTMTRAKHPGLSYWTAKDSSDLTKLGQEAGSGGDDPTDASFANFMASGGKMIAYHGVNDQSISYLETIASNERISRLYPGFTNSVRTFAVPGLMHCSGGPGPTDIEDPLLDALVDWVEKGQAPESIVASRVTPAKGVERTFRLCAEPSRTFLKQGGDLDPAKAENWMCRDSASSGSQR